MRLLHRQFAQLAFAVVIAIAASYLSGIYPLDSLLSRFSSDMTQTAELLPPSLVAEIDQLREEWGIKGTSIMVVKQEKDHRFDEWQEAFAGMGQRDGDGNPMERDVSSINYSQMSAKCHTFLQTLFAMASNAKLFTAIALGMVAHNESMAEKPTPFSLKSKVKELIPEWKLMDPVATKQANFIDLMGKCRSSRQSQCLT